MIPYAATQLSRLAPKFFPDLLWRIGTEARILYFTFDDGPTENQTGKLLDVLAQFDAQATFFLIGRRTISLPDLARAVVEGNHTVGNHTLTHPDPWSIPDARIITDLDNSTIILEDHVQQSLRLMRPPYGRFTKAMRFWCQVRRQRLTMWDVMPGDYLPGATAQRVERHILRNIRPGSVIVLHDNDKASHTPSMLRSLLSILKGEGWQFKAL